MPDIHLNMEPIENAEVIDISTGQRVDRPDIAAKAAGFMAEAIERAGGTISFEPLADDEVGGLGQIGDDEYLGH